MSKFAKKTPATSTPAGRPAAPARAQVQRRSRYAGISSNNGRDGMPEVGSYLFRVLSTAPGHNPGKGTDSYKIALEVVDCEGSPHKPGDHKSVIFLTSGKAGPSGLSRVKAFVVAATGCESDDAYNELDPEGYGIEATEGNANDYAALFESGNPVAGRLVECEVTRGNDDGKGSYYREYQWTPVSDEFEGQDVPSLAAAIAAAEEGHDA